MGRSGKKPIPRNIVWKMRILKKEGYKTRTIARLTKVSISTVSKYTYDVKREAITSARPNR